MRRMPRHRLIAPLLVATCLVAGAAAPAFAAPSITSSPGSGEIGTDSVGTGGVALNGTASATASATVTVSVPPPANDLGVLRVSNDDGTTWVERPWTTSFAWSLIDPAAGGSDADGSKRVVVQGGDGLGAWQALGTATILLDRTGPAISGPSVSSEVVSIDSLDAVDAGVGLARTEVSLDGVHWRSLNPSPFSFYPPGVVDLCEGTIGGSWDPGPHTVHLRAVDKLGNVTEADPLTFTPPAMRGGPDDLPATFEFPLPAVSGQPFTIKPVFDSGFQLKPGQFCQWRLISGSSNVRLEAGYDETYGEVMTSVPARNGVCEPWTFTLPYTPPLEYTWTLSINNHALETAYITSVLAGSFRASPGGTSRAISQSNLPMYSVLPDSDFVGLDGTVTYRLHPAGGAAAASGWWSCFPADKSPASAQHDQYGGSTFVCPVTTSEPWVAYWSREASDRIWRAGYDPVGDRSKPVVTSVRVTPTPFSGLSTVVNARVTWAGRDSGSGLHHYTLQVSRNGGGWSTLPLDSAKATSRTRGLLIGSTYRFRVRATDRAGNVGAWTYTPTFKPTAYDDSTSLASWTSGWTRTPRAGMVGGALRTTSQPAAFGTFKFTGLAVGILAPRAPDQGFLQVYVDGVLTSTVDLSTATTSASTIVWAKSWSSRGTHTIRVRNLGTVGHPGASVDAFVVYR